MHRLVPTHTVVTSCKGISESRVDLKEKSCSMVYRNALKWVAWGEREAD